MVAVHAAAQYFDRMITDLLRRAVRIKAVRTSIPKAVRGPILNWIDPRKKVELLLDVVSACNLRCPSCPVGNMSYVAPTSKIDLQLFERIVAKADRDYNVEQISLFNWGEPLLHPELPALVRAVRARRIRVQLSSNLNVLRNEEALLLEGPDMLRISLSGFTQATYGQTHVRGNIETVKQNMRRLSEAHKATRSRTKIHVYYHKYRHNLHEVPLMRDYAESLGFDFRETWAYYMPLERVVELVEDRLPADQAQFVDTKFALPIREAVAIAKDHRERPCRMLNEQIVLDLKGNLVPCCAVYDLPGNNLGNFLEMTPADLARAKGSEGKFPSACDKCTQNGLHQYFAFLENAELRDQYAGLTEARLKEDALLPK